jgi:hypothetical protein
MEEPRGYMQELGDAMNNQEINRRLAEFRGECWYEFSIHELLPGGKAYVWHKCSKCGLSKGDLILEQCEGESYKYPDYFTWDGLGILWNWAKEDFNGAVPGKTWEDFWKWVWEKEHYHMLTWDTFVSLMAEINPLTFPARLLEYLEEK